MGNSTDKNAFAEVNLNDPEVRAKASLMLNRIFDNWNLSDDARIALIGGSKYEEFSQRAGLIFALAKGLDDLFLHAIDAEEWLKKENLLFQGQSPLRYMVTNGVKGLQFVRQIIASRL